MQLSQSQKIFSKFFALFQESTSNLEYFWKTDDAHRLFVSQLIDCKKWGYLNASKTPCQNTYGQSTC